MRDEALIKRIDANCRLLYDGYSEEIAYTVHVNGDDEQRVRRVRRPGYLTQLREYAAHKDVDRNPKAARGAPRVKTAGRPPGDVAGWMTLDAIEREVVAIGGSRLEQGGAGRSKITGAGKIDDLQGGEDQRSRSEIDDLQGLDQLECDIPSTVDKILDLAGRDRTWACAPVKTILMGLGYQAGYLMDEGKRDLAEEIERATASWVRKAQATLKISVERSMFAATVCECGGALAIAADNSTSVECIGTPAAAACGQSWGPSEWLDLLKAQEGRR